jgi:hypothetical protein
MTSTVRPVGVTCCVLAGVPCLERQARSVQPSVSIPLIRFEMSTLGPFVTGVKENQTLVRIRVSAGSKHRAMQPAAVKSGVGMNPNSTLTLSSRCVVPTRHHSAEKGKVAGTIVKQIFRNLAVIVNLSVKIVEDRKSGPIALRQVTVMRREFHGRIHAKQPGILKIECLPRRGT